MKTLLLLLLTGMALVACHKDDSATVKNSPYPCGQVEEIDSATLHQRLMGSWNLKQQSGIGGLILNLPDQVQVYFQAPDQFRVVKNGSTMNEGTFALFREGSSTINNTPVTLWRLQLSSDNLYLQGYLFTCSSQIAFISSWYDGPDKLFERIQE
jgi:hypothetical protein